MRPRLPRNDALDVRLACSVLLCKKCVTGKSSGILASDCHYIFWCEARESVPLTATGIPMTFAVSGIFFCSSPTKIAKRVIRPVSVDVATLFAFWGVS